jgi:hypothetical protein
MQRIHGTVLKTSSIALALALAGCGGGGGGVSTPAAANPTATTPAAPTAQRTVGGTAAKGLIKGGKVSVYTLDAQGVRGTAALASTITGADGTYKLQIPVSVQSFVIEVTSATGAVMADEATGTDIAIPDSLKLRSVVMLASNATNTYDGTVSPLTEMIARSAETSDGKLPQAAVAQAKINVRTLLGFDPETVKPINSNSNAVANASEDEKNQSLALAAISKMGSVASADCGQSNPGERIACVVTKLTSSVKVTNGQPSLDQHTLAQFTDAIQAVAKDKTVNHTGKDKVVGIPLLTPLGNSTGSTPSSSTPSTSTPSTTTPATGTPSTTTPANPTGSSPSTSTPATGAPSTTPPALPTASTDQVAAAKALFASLRTNVLALDQNDAFRSTADAIKTDLNGTVAPLANDVAGLTKLIPSMADLLDVTRNAGAYNYPTNAVVNDNVAFRSYGSYNIAYGSGNCTISKSPLSITCTVIQANNLPGSMATGIASGTMVYASRVFTLQQNATSTTDYTYSTYLQKTTAQYSLYSITGQPVTEQIGAVQSGTIGYVTSANALSQFTLKGGVTGRMASDGSLISDREDWALNVTRTQELSGLYLYKISGSATAYKGDQAGGNVVIDNTSFARVSLPDSTGRIAQDAANEVQLTLSGTLDDTTVNGTFHASDDKQDKSKTTHTATNLSFSGTLKHKDATVFNGSATLARGGYENYDATAPESDTNFIADALQLSGTLSVASRPDLTLSVGATRTGKDATDISAQYRDGTAVVNASVSAKAGQAKPLVKVASVDGVSFSFADTSTAVRVTKDGAVVAELNLARGMITYIDGTTESIK